MEQQLDTFDEGPYTNGPMEEEIPADAVTDEGSGEQAPTQGQVAEAKTGKTEEEMDTFEDPIDPNSQVNLLEEKEDTGEKEAKESAPEGNEEPKSEDEEPEQQSTKQDDAATNDGETTEDVRTLKAFRDGKAYEVPADATFKVKVAGKNEKVTLEELRDNYSGKTHWDKKFSEFQNDRKTWEEDKNSYQSEIAEIRDHFVNIASLVKGAQAGEMSPTAATEYLLDLMGANTLEYSKAMYEHMAEEFNLYSQMTEVERDSFWTRKENAYLSKKHESLMKSQSERQAQVELQRQVETLREAHGISEEEYVSAEKDLEMEGVPKEQLTPDNIVKAARMKPLVDTAHELIEPYLEQLSDDEANDLIVHMAKEMFENSHIQASDFKNVLAEQFKVPTLVEKIEQRHPTAKTVKTTNEQPVNTVYGYESWDDFDGY
jgi:hypothetical protein